MKLTLNDVTNINGLSVINANFDKIEQELQNKVLYRDNPVGEPNAMQNVLDMNSKQIYNLPVPTSPNEPVRLQDLEDVMENLGTSTSGVFIQAGAGAVVRTGQDKMRENVSAKDFGAVGNGTTNDTAAFSTLEAYITGAVIDLDELTYSVSSIPNQNVYTNGVFKLAKTTTINGAVDNYNWYARAAKPSDAQSGINILRDCSAGIANRNFLLTQTIGLQSFTFDQKNGHIYTLHVSGGPETSFISRYNMAGGTGARVASGVSLADSQVGHQGLTLEDSVTGTPKLWSSVRYESTNFPNGHRQVVRFNYNGNAVALSNFETFTLFGSEFSYTGNSTLPGISNCGRYLVVIGRKDSRDFWVRVFELAMLVNGGAGDYSSKWLYQWNIDRDILRDDATVAFRPVQSIACDGSSIYILSGNSHLAGKRIDRYSLEGRLEQSNSNITVGITEATAEGTFYEPEGIAFYRPNNSAPPTLVLCIVSAGGGAHVNRLWLMGYQSSITEERETLRAGRWMPTASNILNVSASTTFSSHFSRVGNTVHFSGRITIDPTAAGLTTVEITLPIPSNFTSLTDGTGCFACNATVDGGGIEASPTNDTLVLSFIASDLANRAYYFSGMYEVK